MSDLSIIPVQDWFSTQLAQDWNGATGTVYVLDTPSYTPTTTNTYIVVNPWKTNMQIAEITDYDSTANTLTVSNVTLLKGLGINSTAPASSHATGSKVIISDNYQFWVDIQTAINSKLDITGWNGLVYATTAARDSALGADGVPTLPYQWIFVTATGLFYDYNLSTGIWESRDTGTTPWNATTTNAGLVRSDVAPAGIPVALIQDNPKYDALAGTSGTPSTSNKYVTNDDTATAATADKVARRLAGGNITVVTETTGNSTTNASSTAFVQQELAATGVTTSIPFFLGTGWPTASKTYWNYDIPFMSGTAALWTGTNVASVVSYVNWIDIATITSSNANIAYSSVVYSALNSQYAFSSSKKIVAEFFAKCNSVGTDAMAWGLSVSGWFETPYNSAANDRAVFTVDPATSKLYAHTSGGGGTTDHTEVEITGITLTNENRYRVEFDPGSAARFYVNGVLKATITTTLPNSGSVLFWVWTDYVSGSVTDRVRYFTAPNISVEK